jgi:DNA-binding response OmpR family regulator
MSPDPRVVVIDDEPDMRTITELALGELAGWRVRTASSGPEGVRLCEDFRPDVVLLDVMMPGIDGPATLRLLKERWPDLPVLFLTALAQPHEEARYRQLGVDGVIPKPFDPMTLADRLMPHVERKREEPPAPSPSVAGGDEVSDMMQAMAREYARTVATELGLLHRLIESVRNGNPTAGPPARVVAHRVAGTAAAYGFEVIAAAARSVLLQLDEGPDTTGPTEARWREISRSLDHAREEALARSA